ncbi:hypothetical protein [Winogradskyella flava]|uniref:Uncharacterized protein n=1 Tax=Winogradskyella flava TaxID=1884876 RepID=A0A842IQR8_9FLAO|nr:hypothetical protein [Winogradskyella flava]MBC2845065.1 hypothetical protein [Winogradskyella flava]
MNSEENYLKFLQESAQNAFVPLLANDFGDEALSRLSHLTENIRSIYKNLRLRDFNTITVYYTFDENLSLNKVAHNYVKVANVEAFAGVNCANLVVEITDNNVYYSTDWSLDPDSFRLQSIIYRLSGEKEFFFGKTELATLPKLPDSESYFQFRTFKDLEEAFEEYDLKRAKYSSCPHFKELWVNSNRILFNPSPEEKMQESLYDFLNLRLRGSPEVMPEQNVDRSHPVDVKVTWKYSSHVALIEVKWLGKSLSNSGGIVTRTDADARDGAYQLAEYLESNLHYARTKVVSGYLVVFDGRRRGANSTSTTITKVKGEYYRNKHIVYHTKYEDIRADFEKPRRFFMEPITE